jgi:hypothetical protein
LKVLPVTNLHQCLVIGMLEVDNGTPICITFIVFFSTYTSIHSDFHDIPLGAGVQAGKEKIVESIIVMKVLPATNLNPLSVIAMVEVDNGTPICISFIVFLS